MATGQASQLGAVGMEGLEGVEPSASGFDQDLLGLDDVEIAEAAPVEAVADQGDGALCGWQYLRFDALSLAGPSREISLKPGDLPLAQDLAAEAWRRRAFVVGSPP